MVVAGESESKKPQAKSVAESTSEAGVFIAVDDAKLLLAPYVWHRTGAGRTPRAEATMPRAYIKLAFRGSKQGGRQERLSD